MIGVFKEGITSLSAPIPAEWNAVVLVDIDGEKLSVIFNNGAVSIEPGEAGDPEALIMLTRERVCNILDGSIDFMSVWREFAEPSPTDRTYIKKGNGAKFFVLLDGLIKQYKINPQFKTAVDDCKAGVP